MIICLLIYISFHILLLLLVGCTSETVEFHEGDEWGLLVCYCNHLTNFTALLGDEEQASSSPNGPDYTGIIVGVVVGAAALIGFMGLAAVLFVRLQTRRIRKSSIAEYEMEMGDRRSTMDAGNDGITRIKPEQIEIKVILDLSIYLSIYFIFLFHEESIRIYIYLIRLSTVL